MADIGVHGWGPSLAVAFEQGALGLTAVITDPEKVQALREIAIECEEKDPEILFMEWLNALIYEMATRRMLFGRFSVRLENFHLKARVWGESVNVGFHEPAVEVKGATVTCLEVSRDRDDRWHARCVVDV